MTKTRGLGIAIAAMVAVALFAFPAQTPDTNHGPERFIGSEVTFEPGAVWSVMRAQWKETGAPIMDPWESFTAWESEGLRLTPSRDPQITVVMGAMPDNSMGRVGAFAEPVIVDGWIVSCTITIDDSVTQGILTHEVGHCLGLEHVTGKRANESIMNPWENPNNTTVMPLDRDTIARLY